MSYAAIEVELSEGRLTARGAEPLPKSGAGLLVILSNDNGEATGNDGWMSALSEIRQRQTARGHRPRVDDSVAEQVHDERESWD